MDYINQLKARVEEKENKIENACIAITGFMAFLQSSKFVGEENGERKDWISTGDVQRFLSDLRSQLQ